jgi:ABC-type bacteriocin/lantibiotic exporter with double-glycine peptidase domain
MAEPVPPNPVPGLRRRSLRVPEVIQTSAMDCGPAALKSLMSGHGLHVSYDRLREACQTGVDGTSIDALEELAVGLGFPAEQVMLPRDHLLNPVAQALPALVVVRLPSGYAHFVVAWRRWGPWLEVMDPGTGRHWVNARHFLGTTFLHTQPVPAAGWREWASGAGGLGVLRWQLSQLVSTADAQRLTDTACADTGWQGLARLDAACRFVSAVHRASALGKPQALQLLREVMAQEVDTPDTIPPAFWAVRPAPREEGDAEEQVLLSGTVLLRVSSTPVAPGPRALPLSEEMQAALRQPTPGPLPQVLRLLRADGLLRPALVVLGIVAAVLFGVAEALLMRGLFDAGRDLGMPEQRLGALLVLAALLIGTTALEVPLAAALRAMGRLLETRLRLAFFRKIPRLADGYFQSRPVSDMAERSHAIQVVRQFPLLGGQLIRTALEVGVTAVAIGVMDPAVAWRAGGVALVALGLPWFFQPTLAERDLRWRIHGGALARFVLDTLVGLQPVRAHSAQAAVHHEHQALLSEWVRAGRSLARAVVTEEGVTSLASLAAVFWLILGRLEHTTEGGPGLLLLYWSVNLTLLAQDLSLQLRRYPAHRNRVMRLVEPLGAPEAPPDDATTTPPASASTRGVALEFKEVGLVLAGHPVLTDVQLSVRPGEHVAVVGASGAGKSSLVGLLLGWAEPASGTLHVDGQPLKGAVLTALRRDTAWVDPGVHLWNRTLLANLRYGAETLDGSLAPIMDAANLQTLLERLPDGLATPLGEGGALVSGGEGQRVRFGRAWSKDARLVILDEPFRGLDRTQREELLARARTHFKDTTLFCVTHDVRETTLFERVLVLEDGRIVEDGAPAQLRANPESLYARMLEAEADVMAQRWGGPPWRHLTLQRGVLVPRGKPRGEPGGERGNP